MSAACAHVFMPCCRQAVAKGPVRSGSAEGAETFVPTSTAIATLLFQWGFIVSGLTPVDSGRACRARD